MKRSPSDTRGQPSHLDLKCRQCGATISHEKISEKVFRCEYCGASNVVPEKLWAYLHPPASPIESGSSPPEPFPVQDAYQPVPAASGARKSNASVVLASALALGVLAAGTAVSMFLMQSKPVPGPASGQADAGAAEIVTKSDIVPSMEKADPDRTMARILDAVRKNWNPKAMIGRANISQLNVDGTVNLMKGDGSIIMNFFVPELAAGLLPGVTEIKDARCTVYASGGSISASVEEASLSQIKDGRFASALPACPIASLVKAAQKEGFPTAGFADVYFPAVTSPVNDRWDELGMPSFIPGRKKEGESGLTEAQEEKLASLVAEKGWLENEVYVYVYWVAGLEPEDLRWMFSFKDCSPVESYVNVPEFLGIAGEAEENEPGASPSSFKKLATRDIQEVFKTHIPQLKKCFEKLLAADPSIGVVSLPVTVTIGSGGYVKSVSAEWKGIEDKAFRTCLTGSIMKWLFPTSETSYTITYPIVFSGGTS